MPLQKEKYLIKQDIRLLPSGIRGFGYLHQLRHFKIQKTKRKHVYEHSLQKQELFSCSLIQFVMRVLDDQLPPVEVGALQCFIGVLGFLQAHELRESEPTINLK